MSYGMAFCRRCKYLACGCAGLLQAGWFTLKAPKFSPTRTPLAISSPRVNIWYYTDLLTSGKGWRHGQFFSRVSGCLLSLGAALVSTNDRPSIFSIIFRFLPSGGNKIKCAAFCTNRFGGLEVKLQGMSVDVFAAKIEDLTCLCSKHKSNEKTGSQTKTKSFEGSNVSYSLLRTKSNSFLRTKYAKV